MLSYVDTISENLVAGWAHDPGHPETRVSVNIFIGGILAATVSADSFRPDLLAAGLGDGRNAFHFDPSCYIKGESDPIRIAFGITGETLTNGRGTLARSRVQRKEDWDTYHLRPTPEIPPMARVAKYAEEHWPLISVLMPTYNTPARILELAVESVRRQTYPKWELCIADDCSFGPELQTRLKTIASEDPRIRLILQAKNGGISVATNAALQIARGSYVALLDHDDELMPDALADVAATLLSDPKIDIIYTDQDKSNETGDCFEPFHKPDWSPVYFLGVMYVGHLLVARTSLVRQAGGCDPRFDKLQDYELTLRLSELTDRIAHIPRILYHWRAIAGSLAGGSNAKGRIEELQAAAVQAHLDRRRLPMRAVPHPFLPHRVQLFPQGITEDSSISIIIPSRDAALHLGRCLGSIFRLTTYRNFEVIVMDNGTTDPAALKILESYPIRWLKAHGAFNFSRINNQAAREATGDVLVFLNNDTEVVTPDWLQILLGHLALPNVGAVGPLLLYPDGRVQHAGVVLGLRGTADHVMRNFDPHSDGYAGSLPCSREVSAVTAACLMIRRDLYDRLGGMQEGYSCIYQDADLCLRVRESGRSVVYVGNVTLKHHESISRGTSYDFVDRELFIDRWNDLLTATDPFYNPNFTRNRHDYSVR